MRMVVTAPTAKVYGKVMRAGDEFDCPDKEAKLWAALARAQLAGEGEPPAADLLGSGDANSSGRRGRRAGGSYNRRDMRAES